MAIPITAEYCSDFCKSIGFKFISTSIESAKDYVDIMCPKKHIFNINWDAFRYKKKCSVCTKIQDKNRRKTPVKEVVDYINNTGHKIIRFINGYQDNASKFLVRCPNNHEYPTDWQHFKDRRQRCPECYKEQRGGENHYNWKGGVRSLQEYIREKILPWKQESLKHYNYECFITKKKNKKFVIHHHYNFSKLLDETLFNLGFYKYKQVKEYTEEELKLITDECLRLHYKYGYGVPLMPKIHKEFHKLYGKNNNTYEQLLEFKDRMITISVADSTKRDIEDEDEGEDSGEEE